MSKGISGHRKSTRPRRRSDNRGGRQLIERLETRILLTGANEQALLNAIDAALQPSNPSGLSAFHTQLQGSTALGTTLPVVGTGLSNYNPGAALGTLLSRLGSTTYTSVSSLTAALSSGTGITVLSSSDLLNNVELDLQFNATTSVAVPLNPSYGITFSDPGTLTMSTTLSENLTLGAYWDPNISAAVFYVNATNDSIQITSAVTGFTYGSNTTGQLGFLEFDTPTTTTANISGNKFLSTTVSFAPTFTFALNQQPPVDSAESAGRLTLAQLMGVPLGNLVNTTVTQSAPATMTVNLTTPLEPSASKVVFTWNDINAPSTVSSTLPTDPTLTVLNEMQAITPGTISAGLDEVTGDLAAGATDGAANTAGFNTDLPLIDESINNLVSFLGSSTSTAFFAQYLTNYTDPSSTISTGTSNEAFQTDEQLLTILTNLNKNAAPTGVTIDPTKSSITETASGSELIFTLDLDVLIDTTTALSLNVNPALNFSTLPEIYVQTSVNTKLSFGVLASTQQFFEVASTLPTMQVNVNASLTPPGDSPQTYSGINTLGYLAVNVSGATFNLAGTASVSITNPNTNNPPTPGIITSNELQAGPQSGGTFLPVPATELLNGTASAVIPMSVYNLSISGVSGVTANIAWANVSAPTVYTFNSSSLTPYIGFSGLSGAALYTSLGQIPAILNAAGDKSHLGQNLALFGPNMGPTITFGSSFATRTGIQTSTAPATFQGLIAQLDADLGASDIVLSNTSDGIQIEIALSQAFNGNVNYEVDQPVQETGTTYTNLQVSGSVPVSGTYTATLDFGIVLTSAATAATQFYLLGGSGNSNVTASFSSNTTNINATNGEVNLGGYGALVSGHETATGLLAMPLGTGATAQRLTLSNPVTNPDSLYGTTTTTGSASLDMNLSDLPTNGGMGTGTVNISWSKIGSPSSISIATTGLGGIGSAQSPSQSIQTGLNDLSLFVGQTNTSSVLETTLFLLNETADQVINYPKDIQTALGTLVTAIQNGSNLNNAITGATLGPNVTLTATGTNNPTSGTYEYSLSFNFNQPINATAPFNFASGPDSSNDALSISLQSNLVVTANFTGSLTFGYDQGDGFYIYGGTGGNALNLSVQVNTDAAFPDKTIGTFGLLPFGVTGGTAGMSSTTALTLIAPGDNGQKISAMDLAADGTALFQPNFTGTGSINLPFGTQLGTGGPGVISSFTSDWNPSRTQPVEYGDSDGTSLLNGFGTPTYDYTEFADDMLQPVLQQIENYDPIPQQLINALDYEIPIIDMTPAQILEDYGEYSGSDDLSTVLSIISLLNGFPSGGEQLDLSNYLPGAPATGDMGSTDGDNGTSAFDSIQEFVNNLESSTNNVLSMPVFDNVQQSIDQTLLGQPVTLVELNTGPINYTTPVESITILPSTPVFDLGFASVNLSITGGASISLTGDLDIGLSNRGLLANGTINANGTPNTTPDLLDGFFINDNVGTNFPGLGMQQLALEVEANVTITGSLDLGGFLSIASISGSLGPYGEIGVRVNSLAIGPTGGFVKSSSPPNLYEIGGYNGAPPGNGMAYLDELAYIATQYSPTCAVMPDGQIGLQLNVSGTVGYPPIGFSFTVINQQFPIADFDFPCQPTAATLGVVVGNTLVMTSQLSTSDGPNNLSASVLYSSSNENDPIGVLLSEGNNDQILFQTFTFAQIAGVNTLVMDGDNGNDTFNFDPNLSLATISAQYGGITTPVMTPNPAPLQYLEINTGSGTNSVKLTNCTPSNSNLLGVTVNGGNGSDNLQGTYCPDLFTLGYGINTVIIGTANGEVICSEGQDSITGGNANYTVLGGTGIENINLGDGNNVVEQGPGAESLLLGNGKNLVTASTISFDSGIASTGSTLTSGNPAPPGGGQAAFVTANSAITQIIDNNWFTTLGYAISFSAAADPNSATPGGEQIEVMDNYNVIGIIDPTTTAYQNYTFYFTVSSTTVSPVGSNTTTTLTNQFITFKGLDTTDGNNTALIANVQLLVNSLLGYTTTGAPTLANSNFATPSLTGNTLYEPEVPPSTTDYSVADAAFSGQFQVGQWYFIQEIGIDSLIAGNGQNTIHGDIGGATILVGDGQDIVFLTGQGVDSFDETSNPSGGAAGGGNDFVSVSPTNGGEYEVNGAGGKTLLEVVGAADMTLSNQSVNIGATANTPAGAVEFTNIATVNLTLSAPNYFVDVSAWTGNPVEVKGVGNDSVVSTDNTNFTLTDSSLSRSDGTSFTLDGINNADLTSGGSGESFNISNWHNNGILTAGGGDDTLIADGLTDATLSNTLLQRTGAANLTLSGFTQAILGTNPAGNASVNATAFTDQVAMLGEGNGNTLSGGTGSDYIVGGSGNGNLLIGNGTVDNEIIGGSGADDTSEGGGGQDVLVSSTGGGDNITTGSGPSHVYTPGNNNTINAQAGNAIVYNGSTGNTVNTGSSATDQVIVPGAPGTVSSDFVAPTTTDLWEFPSLPVPPTATLPTGTALLGQWVQYGASASGGGVSSSPDTAIEPSIVATGSGSSSIQYEAWADNRNGVYEIYVAEDNSSGWEELAGSAHLGGVSNSSVNATQPSIALDSSGNPMVAWTQGGNIYVADYSPSANSGAGGWVALGSSLSAGGVSNTGDASTPVLAESSSGPVLSWLDTSSGAANVYVKSFNGSTWSALASGSASGKGVSGSSSGVSGLSMATSGANVAIAWSQSGTPAGQSIYLLQYSGSTFSALGGSASGNGISGGFNAESPSIAYSGGSLYAAWAADTDGTNNIVAAESTGSSWTPISISTPSSAGVNQVSRGAASNPILSANGSSLDLVWVEDRLTSTPDQAVAIYANRLVSGAFVDQLPGDSSFDGILGRPTSLSQPATLSLAVDSAGHPFVSWGDNSSGSAQVYMLGDTLNVNKIFYVNGATLEASDSFTTAAGSSKNNGTSPQTPLDSVADVLSDYTMQAGDVILVDSGAYGGFALGASADGILIIGSPGGTTEFTGGVSISGASNLTLQSLDLNGGVTLSDDTNVELNNNTGGPENQLAHNEGGSVSMTDSSGVSLNNNTFVNVALTGGGLSNITLNGNLLPGGGLDITGSVTNLQAENNRLKGVTLAASSQGTISGNDIYGVGLTITSNFNGSISGNFIQGKSFGVDYAAAAPLNNNQIFGSPVGVDVTSASGGLGYFANSTPNFIVNDGTGVDLLGLMQGQFIGNNDIGVSGSGVLGGTSLSDANDISGNTTGVNFNGTVQYNRIDYNGTSIVVQNGQLIDHNLFYDNDGQNLQTLGASDVEIYNNSFFEPNVDNILVNGATSGASSGSADVEIINNILWTGGGFDLDIQNNSITGYFSDYNDLYTTGSGQIVHYFLNFGDILDWQDDVAEFDLHSIGTTVVNPTEAQPQFVNLGFDDFYVLPAAAGIRKTSPTIATGDPETDLGLPASYANTLTNPTFDSGTTGWTVNPGGAGVSTGGFENNGFFEPGSVASGFANQTVNLITAGYSASQIDAGTLDISFGGRIESGVKTPVDQGQLVLTFLNSTGGTLGATTVSATNQTARWELVGDRVHVPVGARSVNYSFQSTRESGSTDASYLSTAFLYILVNTIATDMGAFGATSESLQEPDDEKIQLETPDLYVNWTLTQSHNILWSTFGNTGDDPVKIDLYQKVNGTLNFVTNITPSTPDDGSYAWIPQSSGLSYGTTGLVIKVSLVGQSNIYDQSTETFTIPTNGTTFYVNSVTSSAGQYTTVAGNNRATGLTPEDPLPLLTNLFRSYTLGAQDTVYVDNGTYYDFSPVEISGNPSIGSGQGVTIIGPTNAGDAATINAISYTYPDVIDVNDGSFVTLENLTLSDADLGLWIHNSSNEFTGRNLTATADGATSVLSGTNVGGINLDNTSGSALFSGITTSNNIGDGFYAGGNFISLTNSASFGNTADGFDLANTGAAILNDDQAHNDASGFVLANSSSGTTALGNPNLSLGLGNQAFSNTNYGIYASGGILVAGNTVYGQTNPNYEGIDLASGANATENIVYNNYNGIYTSGSTLSFNNVYSNTNVGIEADGTSTVTGDVSDQNGIGIQSGSAPNSASGPYDTNNLVYDNTVEGISLIGGNGAQINNNTVYQLTGDALNIQAYTGLGAGDVQVENNILWTQNGYDLAVATGSEIGFKSDYNDFYVTGVGEVGQWQSLADATLTNWIDASNQDADSVSINPLFVNTGVDFNVQSTTGSYHGGLLAPILGGSGLPVSDPGTLTADASESPTIDRGDPSFSFANEPSPNGAFINLGFSGNTSLASLSPSTYVLVLKPGSATTQTLLEGQNSTITWRSQNTTGLVNINLMQGSTVVATIAQNVSNSGSFVWAIPSSITPESGYTVTVSRTTTPATGTSSPFALNGPVTSFYVNTNSTGGIFTTAGGNDANSGLDAADPKATIQALLDEYTIGAGDTIFVDEGTYNLTSNIILTAANSGMTIEGVPGDATILSRGNIITGAYDIDVQTAANVTIKNLTLAAAYYGLNASYNNGSTTNMTVTGCAFYGDVDAGLNLDNNFSNSYVDTGDVISDNTFTSSAAQPTAFVSNFNSNPALTTIVFANIGTAWTYGGAAGFAKSSYTSNSGNAGQIGVLPSTSTISQVVPGWGVGSYQLQISAAQDANVANSDENFEVLVDSTVVATITPSSTTYATFNSSEFTVGAGTHTIELLGLNSIGGSNTALINSVSLISEGGNPNGVQSQGDQYTLSGNTAYNLNYGFYVPSVGGNVVSGNTAYNNNVGLDDGNNAGTSTVSGNILYDNYDENLELSGGGLTASGNTVFEDGKVPANDLYGGETGIVVSNGAVATGNVVYGNYYGIEVGGAATASFNLIYNSNTVGLTAGNGGLILGNVLYGNTLGMSLGVDPSAAEGGPVIENNLLYNNTNGGIYLSSGDDTPIINNTIYQTSGTLGALQIANVNTNNVQVRDNIIWSTTSVDIIVGPAAEQNVTIDYNDLYVTGSGQIGTWNGVSYSTLAGWQGASEMDADSLSADPLFVNLAGDDFHVQSQYGSFHGGSLAPILNTMTGLPEADPGTLTDDPSNSPTIDRGAPGDPYSLEPQPNGGYVNLGSYGNSAQASLSPTHYLVVINPGNGITVAAGQPYTITWRDELTNTGAGASHTDTIDVLQGGTVEQTLSAPDTGSYSWTPPTSLPSGTYEIEIIRNDGTGVSATGSAFNLQAFNGTYYVATTGTDSNSGLTPSSPKADIAAILADYTIQPGNTIMVAGGTYTLSTNLVLTTADNGLVIDGVAGATILSRGNLNSGDYDFDFQGALNITLENLSITGAFYGINANIGETLSGLTINTCSFYGDENNGVYLEGNNGSATIENCTFDNMLNGNLNAVYGFQSYAYANSITLIGNTAYGLGYGLYVTTSNSPASASIISNNLVYDNNVGIYASDGSTQPMLVSDNTAYDNYTYNLYVGGTGLTASGNTASEDGKVSKQESSGEIGILSGTGDVVSGNNSVGNVIGIDQSGSGTVTGNTVDNNSGAGIEVSDGDFIINNVVYSNGGWGILASLGYGPLTTISNNLVYSDAGGGIEINGAYETQVLNNTVYETAGNGLQIIGSLSTQSTLLAPLLFQNNILWVSGAGSFDENIADSAESGFTSDYNDLYATGSGQVAQMAGFNFPALSAWAYELGEDDHSLSVNPQFVSIGSGDFHVQNTSPTIDAGNPASEFISEPQPNGGRINLGYDGDTSQAAVSPSATSVQVLNPSSLQKLQVGIPTTINWLTTGLLSTQNLTEVAAGSSLAVGEYHAEELEVGSPTVASIGNTINTVLVNNPAPQAVYQTFAESATGTGSTLAYLIPINNGTYTIRLDFMEPYVTTVGARTFDILLNGQTVQSAFDIYNTAGKVDYKAVSLTFNVTATGGTGISLVLKSDEASWPAILNGFEISQANPGGVAGQTVNVQVSTDGGDSWTTVATNQALDLEGNGSFTWTPTTSSNDAIVQVVANNAANTAGTSAPFLIAPSGSIFYVNGNSTVGSVFTTAVGNNANNGKTPATPMASIEAVLNDYQPGAGDIIEVDNGTYTLFHDINLQAVNSGLTITGPSAASGATAVINRNNTSSGDVVFYLLAGANNITLENLSITGGEYGVYSDNSPGNTGITLAFNLVYSNNGGIETGGIYDYNGTNWLITGNTVHDNSVTSNATFGIYLQSATAMITNNTVYNESEYDIYFSTPGSITTLSANVVNGNTTYASACGIAASQAAVSNNVSYDNSQYGIYAVGGALNSIVTGNQVYKNTATNAIGIYVNSGVYADNNRVYYNYIGVELAGGGLLSVYDNSIYSNLNYGMVVVSSTGNPTVDPESAYDNLIYANSVGGIKMTSDENFKLLDNTVYQLIGDAVNLSGTFNPLTIENNIFWVEAGDDLDVTSTSSQTGLTSNYNDLYNIGANANVGLWNGTAYNTLTNWQAASSEDSHSEDANPNFVDVSGADGVLGYNATANGGNGYNGGNDDNFFLPAGSPAIAAGNAAVQPSTDLLGYTRVTADLGAYAYRGGSAYATAATVTSSVPGDSTAGSSQTNQITVTFNQPPNDADANAASLYVLASTTNNTVYSLTPSFTPGSETVVLSISPAPLVGGTYVFTILSSAAASVHNLNGIPLAGNGSTPGTNFVQTFSITQISTSLSNLTSATTTYGTPTLQLSGDISSGGGVPIGSVSISINGTAINAPINSTTGAFSANFDSEFLGVSGSPYTITYNYLGSGSFAPTSNATQTLTITQAGVTVTLPAPPTNLGFTGSTTVDSWAVATVTGPSGAAAPTGTPTDVYFAGATDTGATLASAPINPGTYTVVAVYNGDSNYLPGQSSPATFTIGQGGETFTGAVNNTTWNNAGNWSLNFVPNQYMNAYVPAGFPSLVIGTGTYTVGALTSASTIDMSGSTLMLYGPAAFGSVALTVNSNASLTLNNNLFAGNIIDNGSVVAGFTSNVTLAANVSGTGTVSFPGSGTVTLTGDNTYSGGTTISSGMLIIPQADSLPVGGAVLNNSALSIQAEGTTPVIAGAITGTGTLAVGTATAPGFLRLAPGGGTSQQNSLTVSPGSTLDISSNTLLVNYGSTSDPIAAITNEIDSGYNNGLWSGPGIISTSVVAANAVADEKLYGVGYADGADGLVHGLSSGAIEIQPALLGDATLAGSVGFVDFQDVLSNFGKSNTHWDQGNFTYGSTLGFANFQIVLSNFGLSSSLATGAGSFNVNWTGGGDGTNWGNAANWSGDAVPNLYDNVTIPSGVSSLQIASGNFAVASLNSASNLKLAAGSLQILGASAFTGSSTLTIGSAATVQLNSGASLTGNIADNGNLILNFCNDPALAPNISGTGSLTNSGMGTVTLTGTDTYTGSTNVQNGTLIVGTADALPSNGAVTIGGAALLRLAYGIGSQTLSSLNISTGGILDVTSNPVFINYGSGADPIAAIVSDLTSGYSSGQWTGTGIDSSTVASLDSGHPSVLYSIGYADGADGVVKTLNSGQIEIMPTLAGDATLSGTVGFNDFQTVLSHFGAAVGWDQGNFTYSSTVSFADFQAVLSNFGQTSSLVADFVVNPFLSGSVAGLPLFSDTALDLE